MILILMKFFLEIYKESTAKFSFQIFSNVIFPGNSFYNRKTEQLIILIFQV